jgi:hypothetical protein
MQIYAMVIRSHPRPAGLGDPSLTAATAAGAVTVVKARAWAACDPGSDLPGPVRRASGASG